jgi:hypothetical protein
MELSPLDRSDGSLHVQPLHVWRVGTVQIQNVELLIESSHGHAAGRLRLHSHLSNVRGSSVLHVT